VALGEKIWVIYLDNLVDSEFFRLFSCLKISPHRIVFYPDPVPDGYEFISARKRFMLVDLA